MKMDLQLYGMTDRPNYTSYSDWVHAGVSAQACAFKTAFSITLFLSMQLLFYLHCICVANSFIIEMTNIEPEPEISSS